jgi:transposase
VILLPATRALYAAVEPVHLRASFDVLFGVARDQLGLDVLRSAIVLFFNRDRTRCKLIFHDGSGFVLLYKRLDRGRFARVEPTRPADRSVTIAARELALLLEGVRPR